MDTGTDAATKNATQARSIENSSKRLELLAPLDGPILAIESVPDPVFAQKLVGNGIAIDPTSSVLLAPCDGKVVQLHAAHHAITLQTASGVQILCHIGLDTVGLKGKGFTPKVKIGDSVKAGQPLIAFDADFLAQNARSLITVIVVAEAPDYQLVPPKMKTARAGQDVLAELTFGGAAAAKPETTSASAGGEKVSKPIKIELPTGLHARPAAQIVAAAKKYRCEIEIRKADKKANAKSVVGILGLEIANGDSVVFAASGAEAEGAVQELARVLSSIEEAPQAAVVAPLKHVGSVKRSSSGNVIAGVAASPGQALGRIHQLRAQKFEVKETAGSSEVEKTALAKAIKTSGDELERLKSQVKKRTDASQAAIFAAHQELLEDPDLIDAATAMIEDGKSAAYSWQQAINSHADRLANLNNELMANRANDLRDVGMRVLRILTGGAEPVREELANDTILVAENLTPSDTVTLDRAKVLGFCTTTGGATSHVAILARSLGLPAIAGIDARALEIPNGTEVVLDGDTGEIHLNPNEQEKEQVVEKQKKFTAQKDAALANANKPATTKDGVTIEVAANIGGVADARQAVQMGCDGVGLLRSEFLFLERTTAPSEDEQFQVYQEIADILGARPLIIRTLDVGGDKPLQYLPIPAEENPFLGVRGLRVGFLMPEILREQLRAILRVKTQGTLHIMFPMVAMLDELIQAKAMLEEERVKLGAPKVKIGIMIEVPSAALMAHVFAPEVDFFSIGTNDLTQYTLAMDRGHADLAKQVDGLHPSVLRLIEMTVQAAHNCGKWVGVCGGLASDAKAVPILLGLGVDELSVSLPAIPLVKAQIRDSKKSDAEVVAKKAVAARDGDEVRALTTASGTI